MNDLIFYSIASSTLTFFSTLIGGIIGARGPIREYGRHMYDAGHRDGRDSSPAYGIALNDAGPGEPVHIVTHGAVTAGYIVQTSRVKR